MKKYILTVIGINTDENNKVDYTWSAEYLTLKACYAFGKDKEVIKNWHKVQDNSSAKVFQKITKGNFCKDRQYVYSITILK